MTPISSLPALLDSGPTGSARSCVMGKERSPKPNSAGTTRPIGRASGRSTRIGWRPRPRSRRRCCPPTFRAWPLTLGLTYRRNRQGYRDGWSPCFRCVRSPSIVAPNVLERFGNGAEVVVCNGLSDESRSARAHVGGSDGLLPTASRDPRWRVERRMIFPFRLGRRHPIGEVRRLLQGSLLA